MKMWPGSLHVFYLNAGIRFLIAMRSGLEVPSEIWLYFNSQHPDKSRCQDKSRHVQSASGTEHAYVQTTPDKMLDSFFSVQLLNK